MFIILLLFILLFIFFKKQKIKTSAAESEFKKRINVSQQYHCDEGTFQISGYKDNFIINKNSDIEFLIKDGQIIATRDLRVSNAYVYYGGKSNGNN